METKMYIDRFIYGMFAAFTSIFTLPALIMIAYDPSKSLMDNMGLMLIPAAVIPFAVSGLLIGASMAIPKIIAKIKKEEEKLPETDNLIVQLGLVSIIALTVIYSFAMGDVVLAALSAAMATLTLAVMPLFGSYIIFAVLYAVVMIIRHKYKKINPV